jgi:hypothetical protein
LAIWSSHASPPAARPNAPASSAAIESSASAERRRRDWRISTASCARSAGGTLATGLADFYRKLRAVGAAGVTVPLDVAVQGGETRRIDVQSINRLDHLKLKSTL